MESWKFAINNDPGMSGKRGSVGLEITGGLKEGEIWRAPGRTWNCSGRKGPRTEMSMQGIQGIPGAWGCALRKTVST